MMRTSAVRFTPVNSFRGRFTSRLGKGETASGMPASAPIKAGAMPGASTKRVAPQPRGRKAGLLSAAQQTANAGRGGDSELVHVNPQEKQLMERTWGPPRKNPNTGLAEYGFFSKVWKKAKGAIKSVGKFVKKNWKAIAITVAAVALVMFTAGAGLAAISSAGGTGAGAATTAATAATTTAATTTAAAATTAATTTAAGISAAAAALPEVVITASVGGGITGAQVLGAAGAVAGAAGATGAVGGAGAGTGAAPSGGTMGPPKPPPSQGFLSRAGDAIGKVGKFATDNPGLVNLAGNVIKGAGEGAAAEEEQRQITERQQYIDRQWRDPNETGAIFRAVGGGGAPSTGGYLSRAQQANNAPATSPGDPDKVYGSYVRGQ